MKEESNLNLPPFYVGQKVVYITGKMMAKDSIWTVLDIKKFSCNCGWSIKIEKILPMNPEIENHDLIECGDCNAVNTSDEWKSDYGYWAATSFKPLEQLKYPLIKLSKVLEETQELVAAN